MNSSVTTTSVKMQRAPVESVSSPTLGNHSPIVITQTGLPVTFQGSSSSAFGVPVASTSKRSSGVAAPSIVLSTSDSGPSKSSTKSTEKRQSSNNEPEKNAAKKKAKPDAADVDLRAVSGNGAGKMVYQLKVGLEKYKPPVWRRIHMSEDTTFYQLHKAIQQYMGWSDSHLHEFRFCHPAQRGLRRPGHIRRRIVMKMSDFCRSDSELSELSDDEDDATPTTPSTESTETRKTGMFENFFDFDEEPKLYERKTKIADHFEVGKGCSYVYDFGCEWCFYVLLEKILPAKKDEEYPKCITMSKGVCPPEDPPEYSGGESENSD